MSKLIALLCIYTTFMASAQDSAFHQNSERSRNEKRKQIIEKLRHTKLPKDRIAVDLLGTNWIHQVGNGFSTKWYSRGINVYFYYDFRIKKSLVSFAPGIGYGAVNIYHRSEMLENKERGISFEPMDASKLNKIRTNKVTLQYIDIPLELRIRTLPDKADNFWKFAIGFKAGVRVGSHTKQKLKDENGTKVYVERRFPDFSLFRAGPTLRIGYSVFNITAYFGVIEVFKSGRGPKANEFAVGISFNGL